MNHLAGKFSLKMLRRDVGSVIIRIDPITHEDIPEDVRNHIGHPSMVNILKNVFGIKLGNRQMGSVRLGPEDVLYVATHTGTYLPENAKELPEGATISFSRITWQPAER